MRGDLQSADKTIDENIETIYRYRENYSEQEFKDKIKLLITELIGEDEDGYESPVWDIAQPAVAYVAYAEGWDKCKEYLRSKLV